MINNKREPIAKYISLIYRKGNCFINREVSKFGIGSGQIMFLMQLYNKDGISQEELSENLNIDKATTCRAIKKLEEQGLLTRVKDEKDKRAYKLYLTIKFKLNMGDSNFLSYQKTFCRLYFLEYFSSLFFF